MQYTHIVPARFCRRPNRFIAEAELPDGSLERVHVKNTGRCRELLVPGARIYLEGSQRMARKTRFDLVAVEKGSRLINMDAQAPTGSSASGPDGWFCAGTDPAAPGDGLGEIQIRLLLGGGRAAGVCRGQGGHPGRGWGRVLSGCTHGAGRQARGGTDSLPDGGL